MKAISLKIKWTWRKQENKKDPYDLRGVTLKLLLFVAYLPKLAAHPNK